MKENTNTATLAENSLPKSSVHQKFSVDRILAPTDFLQIRRKRLPARFS